MIKAVYLALARVCYSLVVVFTAGFALFIAFQMVKAVSANFWALVLTLAAAAFLMLAGGGLLRRWRGQPLLPEPTDHREWAFVFFMTCAGSFAHFLAGNVCLAIYQYIYVYPDRDREGGPLAGISIVAAFFYLLTLLMGEFGIRHDKRMLQARINPSSGRTDALSGNTLESSAPDETPR